MNIRWIWWTCFHVNANEKKKTALQMQHDTPRCGWQPLREVLSCQLHVFLKCSDSQIDSCTSFQTFHQLQWVTHKKMFCVCFLKLLLNSSFLSVKCEHLCPSQEAFNDSVDFCWTTLFLSNVFPLNFHVNKMLRYDLLLWT